MDRKKTNSTRGAFDDLGNLASRLPGLFYWKDKEGYYLGCSEGLLKILELQLNNLIGKTDHQLWPQQAGVIKAYDEQVITCRKPITSEETLTVASGEQKVLLVTRVPWEDEHHNIIGIVGNLFDITAQKKKEIDLKNDLKDIEFELKKAKETAASAERAKIIFLENTRLNIHTRIDEMINFTHKIKQENNNQTVQACVDVLIKSGKSLQDFLSGIQVTPIPFGMPTVGAQKIVSIEKNKKSPKVSKAAQVNQIHQINQKKNYGPRRILIVEDHPITAKITQTILSDFNCAVEIAINGELAIQQVKKSHYDLILMDIGLPDIDGCEVTRQIRFYEATRGTYHTPIIGLTARVDSENQQRCLEVGMNAVFSKPLMKEKVQDIFMSFVPKYKTTKDSNVAFLKKREEKVIDLTLGAHLIGGDEDLAKEAIIMMVNSFPEEMEKLDKAYQKSDWQGVQMIVHKLRGGTSYCGTPRLKEACIRLDDCLQLDNKEEAGALYQQLLQEIEAIRHYIRVSQLT